MYEDEGSLSSPVYTTWGCVVIHRLSFLSTDLYRFIERFHSRGQHVRKFIATNESVCITKEFTSHRTGLGHQHGRRDVIWKHSIRHFEVARETGLRWLSKCIVGLFWGRSCHHVENVVILTPRTYLANRPFPSSPGPLYQNEVKCSAFDMKMIFHSHANKTHFHKKGSAPGLILKVRAFGTRKWPLELDIFASSSDAELRAHNQTAWEAISDIAKDDFKKNINASYICNFTSNSGVLIL